MFESLGRGTAPEESEPAFSAPHPPHGEDAHSAVHAQIAQAAPLGEPIGAVVELTGSVTVTHADGSSETAAPGAPVFLDDTVTTGTGSSVEIQFVDGTRFSLGQDGQMVLDQLVYDPGGSSNELDLSVVQGAFTFVTGSIAGAPGEGMEVRVPVGTIGIRGTAVGAGPDTSTADPTDYTVVLLPEQGGRAGRIVLTDLFGRSVILDQALEAMDISSLGLAPGEPVQLTREQVIALLGLSIQNIEDILNEIENFEIEDSPEDDINPEAGPEQEGQLFDAVPNNGGIRTQLGETFTLGQLTSLFSLSDQQGLGGLGGQNGGFTPAGGLGGNQGNDDDPPQDEVPNSTGPDETTDLPPDDNTPDGSGLILLTGGDGDDVLDASGFSGPTSITGLGGNDTLIGSAFDDILNGGDGNDTLNAGAGNDQVNGGAGNDLIIGGSGQGNDALDGGSGIDTVSYSSATQAITVNLTTGVAFGDPAIGNDTLSNIENVIGGKGSDSITGDGADNVLYGGEGNDTLAGLGGDDTIIGGQGVDTAVFTGNYDDYIIEGGEGGFWITDTRDGAENDGTDFVADDVEVLRFNDGDFLTSPNAVDDVDTVTADDNVDRTATNGAAMKTTIEVAAGAVLTVRYNFLDSEPDLDEGTFKDFAVVVIGDQVIKLADVDQAELPFAVVGTNFDEQTGYRTFSLTFTESGAYTLGFAVTNEDDEIFDAGLLIDSVSISGGGLNDNFDGGLDNWDTLGQVSAVGTYGDAAPSSGGQQALLLTEDGLDADELEVFLGLNPGQLSEIISRPSISGNVLDNDGLSGADVAVASVAYLGDSEDVEVETSENLVTFTAEDGSWELRFDLSNGTYVFTVLGPLDYQGGDALSFDFRYVINGLNGSSDDAVLTIVVEEGLPSTGDNHPPSDVVDVDLDNNTIDRQAANGAEVGITAFAADGDLGDEITYSLSDDAGGIFAIDPSTGVVTLANQDQLGAIAGQSLSITIVATDMGGLQKSLTLDIAVTNESGIIFGTPQDDPFLQGTFGNDHIVALDGNDIVYGFFGNDKIEGGAGADILFGAEGNDNLIGGADDDVLVGGQGNDVLDGGDGMDTVSYADAWSGINVDLDDQSVDDDGEDGSDVLIDIENVIGSTDDDQIYGDAGTNIIAGNGGADVIDARGGDDFIVVANQGELASLEVLNGGDGFDTLIFGEDDVVIDLSVTNAISNIERIDISGADAVTLILTVEDVLEEFGGVLEIVADADDEIISLDQGWTRIEQGVTRNGNIFDHYVAADNTVSLYVSPDAVSPDTIS